LLVLRLLQGCELLRLSLLLLRQLLFFLLLLVGERVGGFLLRLGERQRVARRYRCVLLTPSIALDAGNRVLRILLNLFAPLTRVGDDFLAAVFGLGDDVPDFFGGVGASLR